jgi:hypothetical protein
MHLEKDVFAATRLGFTVEECIKRIKEDKENKYNKMLKD